MPNTILTLMYNVFKVREEETLYKHVLYNHLDWAVMSL